MLNVEREPLSPVHRLLVVEDAPAIAGLVKGHLQEIEDTTVTVAHDGKEAHTLMQRYHFDLIVLDLMLPGMSGLELCSALRTTDKLTPVIMLTAKASELDRIIGLEHGADDYIVKPFSVLELTMRVKATLRRAGLTRPRASPEEETSIRFGAFALDTISHQLLRDGTPVPLTSKEFDLLCLFARNPGRAYSRSQLLDLVWSCGRGVYEHTVNSHINRLRVKIEERPDEPRYIETVWGVGYRFNPGAKRE